jgi:DNA segregation ATPase FtsK/SpoIIIE-like protein
MSGADLSDALSDMWRSVLLFVPTALAFLAILLVGYVLARLVRTVVVKTLRRVGFDRAVERGAIGKALGGRVEPSDLCAKIAFYAVLLFALQLAFGIWGPNAVSDLLTALIGWLPRAFVAIVIIVVAAAIGRAVRDLIGSALGGLAYGRVLAQVAYWLIVALGVIAALDQVRIATAVTQPVLIAVLATVAGVLIVGVGGGLIRPMQQRWEIWLDRAGAESATIREHARSYAEERARAAAEKKAAEKKAAEEEAARAAEARAAEKAAQEEAARVAAEQERKAEQERIAEAQRQAREAEVAKAQAGQAAKAEAARVAEDDARKRALEADEVEKTQVIPVQRPWPGSDDKPHVVPGFDDREPAGSSAEPDRAAGTDRGGAVSATEDSDSTVVISPSERRQALSRPADPADDKTQVIRVRPEDAPGS